MSNRHWYALAVAFRNMQSILFLMAHARKIARAMGSGSILLHLSDEECKRLEAFGEVLQRTEFEPNPEELRAAMMPLENPNPEELRAAMMPLENLGRRASDALHPELIELLQKRVNGRTLSLDERNDLSRAIGCDQRDLMPDDIEEMLDAIIPKNEAERRAEMETRFLPPEGVAPRATPNTMVGCVNRLVEISGTAERLEDVDLARQIREVANAMCRIDRLGETPPSYPGAVDPEALRAALAAVNADARQVGERDRRTSKSARAQALEEARKLCVLRMINWTAADDVRSQDFRDGIERACSDLACKLFAKIRELKR